MSGCTVTRSTTLLSSTSTYSPSSQTGVASSNSSLISLQYEEQSKLTLARTRHILDIVIQATFNTHNIELQPRPRDCNESIIINQVLVLTLARTRHIPDIVIQATTVTRHIEHSAKARPISQSTMNQSTSTRTHHPEALLKSQVFLRDQNWTSTRTHHPEVLLKSLAFIRDKYLDINQDNHPEVFYSSHEFSSETRN